MSIMLWSVFAVLVVLVVVPTATRLIARAWFDEQSKYIIKLKLSRIINLAARKGIPKEGKIDG